MKVFFETFGCQMNVADSAMFADLLNQRGIIPTKRFKEADLIVVNTCSVRERAESRAKARLTEFSNLKKKHQRLWAIGCMAERMGQSLRAEIPGIDQVIGSIQIEQIADHIDLLLGTLSGHGHKLSIVKNSAVTEFVPVMRGCDNFCSYCIVPFVRGREHSIPASIIMEHCRKLVDNGIKEITLLGQNVNSYSDGSTNFSGLVERIHEISGLLRIRFTTSHPKDLSNTLIQTIARLPKVCRHIHLPVQSGSSTVLARMNRHYTKEQYIECVYALKSAMPDIDITTDVMTGFPGETDSDFSETMDLFRAIRFTSAFMFIYSKREQTAAATLPDQIDESVKKERMKALVDMQTAITKEIYAAMVGHKVEVLCVERNIKDGSWIGQDYGCKRVLVSGTDDLAGRCIIAKVVRSSGKTLVAVADNPENKDD